MRTKTRCQDEDTVSGLLTVLQKLEIHEENGGILRFSTIKEYYTKSEGLGFLIQNLESTSVLNSGVWISYMNSIRQSIAESTFSNWSGQTWPRDEKESWQVHEQFHWTLQSGVIMEWVVTQKTVPPSEFGHGSCGSFKTESVWSSGRTVRPSVRPFQWLARVELVFMSTTVQSGLISFGPSVHGPYQWLARVALVITTTTDQFYPTRKEGRAQILQKPAQGHENFQHLWPSNMMANFKEG